MKATGSHKQIKQSGKARIQQPLGAVGKDWKQELKERAKKREEKKRTVETRKQVAANAKKDRELEAEINEVMDKEKKVEKIIARGKQAKKQAKQVEPANNIIQNGEHTLKLEEPHQPLEEIIVKAERKSFIVTRDQDVAEKAAASEIKTYLLGGNGIKISGVETVQSIREIASHEGEVILVHKAKASRPKGDPFVQIVSKNGKWVNPHLRKQSGSFLAFEALRSGGLLSEVIAKARLAFACAKCTSSPEGRVQMMIRLVERQHKQDSYDYSKFELLGKRKMGGEDDSQEDNRAI